MSDNIDVVLLINGLGAAGAPKVILNLSNHLSNENISLSIWNCGEATAIEDQFAQYDVDVRNISVSLPYLLPEITSLIRNRNPDILHTHMMLASAVGRIAGQITNTPVISTIHTSFPNRTVLGKTLDYSTSPLATVNVPVSEAVSKSLPHTFGGTKENHVIHNSIDIVDIQRRGNVPWDELQWTDDLDQNNQLIASVARFDPKKRREDLVRAMKYVHDENPNSKLLLTGGESEEKRKIEDIVQDINAEHYVKFLGFVENPYPIYFHSDIICLPSISEGFSIGMLEAMAFGKPIVATDIDPFQEALGDDYDLVPIKDPMGLSSRIDMYLNNKDVASEHGIKLRSRVSKKFSNQTAADNYYELYQSVKKGKENIDGGSSNITNENSN